MVSKSRLVDSIMKKIKIGSDYHIINKRTSKRNLGTITK